MLENQIINENLLDFVSKLSIIRYQYAEIMNASAQDLGNNGDRIKEFASILISSSFPFISYNQALKGFYKNAFRI